MIHIITPGTNVIIDGHQSATVELASIGRDLRVTYQCHWWDRASSRSEWVHASRVMVPSPKPKDHTDVAIDYQPPTIPTELKT